jgi:PAS domain S-box-containing protein
LIEEKIREKDLQFRKLSANVPDLIYQFTRKPDGTYCVPIASAGIKNIFGCSPEDVFDNFEPIARVIHPDDTARVIEDIEYSANHLSYFTCEFRVKIPGKETQWIYSRSNPEKLPDGSITWYGFNVDITERKKSEESLHKREAMLNKIFDVLPVGLWLADKAGNLIRSNAKGREIWGVEPLVVQEEYGVFKARSLPSGKELAPQDWALAKTIKDGVTIKDEMLEIDASDGKKKIILNYTAPIFDIYGNIDGAIVVNSDITERKLAEDAILRQNTALSNLNKFSIELSEKQSNETIEAFITKKIKEISGAEVAIFSEYNSIDKTSSLRHIEIEAGKIKELVRMLGKSIKRIKSPINNEIYREIISKRIGFRKTLHEASFGAVSRPISASIQTMLNIDRYIGLAYMLDGKLYGTSLLAMRKDTPDPPIEILENFINMAALAIKRKQSEKALIESEDRFKKLSSFTFEGIIIHNNAIAIDVNQSTVNILGYERDELIGMNLFNVIHPDSHALVKANMPKQVALPYKIVLIRKDGTNFYAEIEARNISYNGEYFRVACIRDITERKKAEVALLESEAKFREMAELLPQIVFESDIQGNLTYVNKQAYKLSGYSENDNLIGKSTLNFYIPEIGERLSRIFKEVLKSKANGKVTNTL